MQLSAKNLLWLALSVVITGAAVVAALLYAHIHAQDAVAHSPAQPPLQDTRVQQLASQLSQNYQLAMRKVPDTDVAMADEPDAAPASRTYSLSEPYDGAEVPASTVAPKLRFYATKGGQKVDFEDDPLETIDIPTGLQVDLGSGSDRGRVALVLGRQTIYAAAGTTIAVTAPGVNAHLQFQPDGTVRILP